MQIANHLSEMNTLIAQGQIVQAVDQFFDPEAITVDFDGSTTSSKSEKSEGLTGFLNSIRQVNKIQHKTSAIEGNVSLSEYEFDFDMKDGSRIQWHEVIRREWKNGKVVHEQYFKN